MKLVESQFNLVTAIKHRKSKKKEKQQKGFQKLLGKSKLNKQIGLQSV